MADKEQLINIFEDTKHWCEENQKLAKAVEQSIRQTRLYMEDEYPALPKLEPSVAVEGRSVGHQGFLGSIIVCNVGEAK